jgi:hypothetical protein
MAGGGGGRCTPPRRGSPGGAGTGRFAAVGACPVPEERGATGAAGRAVGETPVDAEAASLAPPDAPPN